MENSRGAGNNTVKNMIRKIIKYLLPYGFVRVAARANYLKNMGIGVRLWQINKIGALCQALEFSRLNLFEDSAIQKLDCVVDVGAHVGLWSMSLLECVKTARVIAFEPAPDIFKQLKKRLCGFSNVQVFNIAVGSHKGNVKFNIKNDSGQLNSILELNAETKDYFTGASDTLTQVDVCMDTLDNLLADQKEISLLKIDVQGYEEEVLKGAVSILKKTRFVLIEWSCFVQYEGGVDFTRVHEILTKECNFQLYNFDQPMVIKRRAMVCDGLYVNKDFL